MNHDPLSVVLDRLRGGGREPFASGNGYSCRCPAHEDRSPSLTIGIGADCRVLLNCKAGCSFDAVLESLRLEPKDLFPESASASTPRRSSARPAGKPKQTFPTVEAAVAGWERIMGRKLVRRDDYHDADGRHVVSEVRFPEGDDGKTFRQVMATAGGAWTFGLPTPRPIYRLPQVLAADGPIYVAEGCKATDALVSLGLTATTSPNGSESAAKAEWSPLRGRRVVIVPDRDKPGEEYADAVADLALRAGAESVVVARLADLWPGLPEGGDAHDWIEAHDAVDAVDLREALETLVAKAEPVAAVAAEPDEDDVVIEWQTFPVEQLPEPLATFVKETARGIGCDESMVALPLLAAVAGAIGNARAIEAQPGHIQPAVLWTAVVAESGSGKTPAFKAATRFAAAEQKVAHDAYRVALADFDAAVMEHDAAYADWKREKGRGGPAPDRPVKPVARRLVVNDVTMEALISILADNPRGVLVAVDELAGLVASFDAYKSGGRGGADRAKWLSMHTAEPVENDRKSSGYIHVDSAAVSVTGGIQPGMLARTMTPDNVDSGLLARLLAAMPPKRRKQWQIEPVGFGTMQATKDLFAFLYAMPMPADGPKVLDMTPDALEVFRSQFFEQNADEVFSSSGALGAMLSKADAAVLRLALVVHVSRQAAGPIGDRVDVESITRAIVLGRWFAREGRRVYQLLLGGRAVDRAADDAAAAERWIEAKGGFASLRDLRKGLSRFREDDERAEQAARRLVAERRARWEAPITGGRPADGIRLAG